MSSTVPAEALVQLNQASRYTKNLDQVANELFEAFDKLIPFERIGIALISKDRRTVTLLWMRSKLPVFALKTGYSARLKGSSLAKILETEKPRIINDLKSYFDEHPHSESTRRILEDGIRSSLTCPLLTPLGPIGFLFFSSPTPNTYSERHVQIFRLIADTIAGTLERELGEKESEVLNSKEDFFRKVLHDLRNPVFVIGAHAELLKKRSDEPNVKKSADTILRQCQSLNSLLEDIQNGLELGSNDFEVKNQETELKPFLENLRSASEILAAAKKIRLIYKSGAELPEKIFADPQRLTQVVGNLLTNAIKFSPSGSSIYLAVEKRRDELVFSLRDEGPGIAPQELASLFETKNRLKNSLPTAFERCSGLGLLIAKSIVEQHGGKIWAESHEGLGSVFSFSIPL